jgi:formiminotetrahydrofolate cyclodeaminase
LQCIDRSGTVLIQSPRLDIETELVQLLELGQSVVGIDSNGNVITFNLYGNLTERISLNATDLLTNNESIYAVCKDGKILRKDSNWNTICQIKTLDVDINLLDIQDSKLIEHNLPLNIKKVIYYLNN